MPFVSGTFIRDNSAFTGPLVWTDDRDAGTKITSAHHDYHDQDIADGLSMTFLRDGSVTMTGTLDLGGHKAINMTAGSTASDGARTGQTVTAATFDSGTNVLTLTRADGDVTVDLSALAVGGSTTDFARYSNLTNPFQGSATFGGTVSAQNEILIGDILTGGTVPWLIDAFTGSTLAFSPTSGAVSFKFLVGAGDPAGGRITIGSYRVWDESTLTPTQVAGLLSATSNTTITGTWTVTAPWTFTNTSLKLPGFLWSAGTGGTTWTAGPIDASSIVFTDPGGLSPLSYVIDAAPKAGAYLQIGPNAKRAWDQGSLQSGLTAAPTGGEDGNLAVVQSGAARGLYTRISGTWTLLIAFP